MFRQAYVTWPHSKANMTLLLFIFTLLTKKSRRWVILGQNEDRVYMVAITPSTRAQLLNERRIIIRRKTRLFRRYFYYFGFIAYSSGRTLCSKFEKWKFICFFNAVSSEFSFLIGVDWFLETLSEMLKFRTQDEVLFCVSFVCIVKN